LTGYAQILELHPNLDTPVGAVRIHFCAHDPCRAVFNGVGAPVPWSHAKAIKLITTDEAVSLQSFAFAAPTPAPSPPPPPCAEPAHGSTTAVERHISIYASRVQEAYAFIGLYSFLAYAIEHQREVREWLTPDEYCDVVDQFAPWFVRAGGGEAAASSSATTPAAKPWKRVEVIATIVQALDENVVEVRIPHNVVEACTINHYLPIIKSPLPRAYSAVPMHEPCDGSLCRGVGKLCYARLNVQLARMQRLAVHTTSDGNCGIECMLYFEGIVRNEHNAKQFRRSTAAYILSVAGIPNWQDSWNLCGEYVDIPHAKVPASHVDEVIHVDDVAAEPLGDAHALAGIVEPEAPAEPLGDAQPPLVASSAVEVDGMAVAQAEPSCVGLPKDAESSCAPSPQDDAVALAAVLRHVGLKRLDAVQAKRLMEGIDKTTMATIVGQYKHALAANRKSLPRKLRKRRMRIDETATQKRADTKTIAAYCSKNGIDPDRRLPHKFWKNFFGATYESADSALGRHGTEQGLKMYWLRRLHDCGAKKQFVNKKSRRATVKQGRSLKGQAIDEELVIWFAALRRRGVRITHAAFFRQAKIIRLQMMRCGFVFQ